MSVLTGNLSQVDKLWSILPFFYVWFFLLQPFLASGFPASFSDFVSQLDARLLLMATLTTLWGVRLTYNFWRKGGYEWHGEDYRWPVVRTWMHPILMHIFNIFFIAIYQNILLFLLSAPAYFAWLRAGTHLNAIDYAAAALFLFFLGLETVADQQQWNFQTRKYALIAEKKKLTGDYAAGFLRAGLFRYSRHPNFFSEQLIWCTVYLFSVAASGQWVNWTAAGALLLIGLFQGSTWMTEMLTAKKYPLYKQYQKTTSRFVPWFPAAEKNE